jgi:hypothetical protein
MLARTRDRLEALEAKIAPKAKAFVFISFDAEPGAPSREDRLAAFKGSPANDPAPFHDALIVHRDCGSTPVSAHFIAGKAARSWRVSGRQGAV